MQSLDPLPMHGRDLGVNPDDLVDTPDVVQEAKQEILENKDVSTARTWIIVALLKYEMLVFTSSCHLQWLTKNKPSK